VSASLLVFAPLRVEAAALKEAPGWRVLRSGMGMQRARIAAARGLAIDSAQALAIVGLCAGVSSELRAGDVVCATELRRDGAEPVPAPASALLVAALRRRGLRVHAGPIFSSDHIVGREERAALAAQGVLAADMESAWLADAANGRPLAVLRVVVDPAGRRLLDPRTPFTGLRALRNLRRAGKALPEWLEAIGPRRVLLAAPRSFCAGVERAIEIVDLVLERRGAPIYVRKQIVHNEHVVAEAASRGAVFVNELDEVPAGAVVIFSAHGVSPAVRQAAGERGLEVIDATCPLVSKVHAEARRFAARGDTIFLLGHARHEEVEGVKGEAPESIVLVDGSGEAASARAVDPEKVSYLTQTTLAVDETSEIVGTLRGRYPALRGPSSDDICYATANRQRAVRAVARESDVVLVVGSATSSNSRRLVEVARREGVPAHLVDDETDVDVAWLKQAPTVGLTAGASAPERLVNRLIEAIGSIGEATVEERQATTESLQFRLPRELGAS
jgi:4-hydroxy-3-methylbut-2-enyl diphosphate reductase